MSHRVAPGIFKTPTGYRAFVWVPRPKPKGRILSKRFKRTAMLTTMKDWRIEAKRLAKITPIVEMEPLSGFAADVARYLPLVRTMPTYTERVKHLADWTALFVDRPRSSITSHEIDAQLAVWLNAGLAPGTVKHRRTALLSLWTRLDGKSAPNPIRDVRTPREPSPTARALSYETIRQILGELPDGPSKAWLSLLAWTGIPPAQLRRIQPGDVDWRAPAVLVAGRQKGRGTRARRHPLTADGVRAFRDLARWQAWGQYHRWRIRRAFRAACRSAEKRYGLSLADARPYDLRHSYGTAIYAATGDIRATQELMGHANPTQTIRYTLGAVDARVRLAVNKFGEATRAKPRRVTLPSSKRLRKHG